MNQLNAFLKRRTLNFLAIYEEGNIHKAAARIGVTQPALTMSLRQLETEVGTKLFERSVKGVKPTDAGEIYYRFACTLRQNAGYAMQEIDAKTSGNSGTLKLGAGVAWAATIVPNTLIKLKKQFPDLSLELITGVADQLGNLFEEGKLDILIAAGPLEPLNSHEYYQSFLTNIPMIAMADPSNQLVSKKKVSIEQLAAAKWAGFYEDDTFVYHAKHFLARYGLPAPEISMRTNSIVALTEFVRGTDTIILVTSPLIPIIKTAGLATISLKMPLWEIPISIYVRKSAKELASVKAVSELIKTAIQPFSDRHL